MPVNNQSLKDYDENQPLKNWDENRSLKDYNENTQFSAISRRFDGESFFFF